MVLPNMRSRKMSQQSYELITLLPNSASFVSEPSSHDPLRTGTHPYRLAQKRKISLSETRSQFGRNNAPRPDRRLGRYPSDTPDIPIRSRSDGVDGGRRVRSKVERRIETRALSSRVAKVDPSHYMRQIES